MLMPPVQTHSSSPQLHPCTGDGDVTIVGAYHVDDDDGVPCNANEHRNGDHHSADSPQKDYYRRRDSAETTTGTDTNESSCDDVDENNLGRGGDSDEFFDADEVGDSTTTDSNDMFHLLTQQAEALYADDKLLEAARLLRRVPQQSLSDPKHRDILAAATEFETAIADLVGPPEAEWTKQKGTHGRRPADVYFKLEDDGKLTCRIDCPVEASLLVPLLSVFNETELYKTWIPGYRVPRLGIQTSEQLSRAGRGEQLIRILVDCPWPLTTREVIIHAVAVDDIDEQGYIVVRMKSQYTGPHIPPPSTNLTRVKFRGAILFRPCPSDHELLQDYPIQDTSEPLVLVSFKIHLNSSLVGVPTSLINFVTKTVIGQLWGMLIRSAEKVQAGALPQHAANIAANPDLYEWIEQRCEVMLAKLTQVRQPTVIDSSTTGSTQSYNSPPSSTTDPGSCPEARQDDFIAYLQS